MGRQYHELVREQEKVEGVPSTIRNKKIVFAGHTTRRAEQMDDESNRVAAQNPVEARQRTRWKDEGRAGLTC